MRKPLFQRVVLAVCLPGLPSAEPPPLEGLAITGAVERRLRIDEAVPEARIDVSTHEGIVTLSGFVAVAPVDIPIWLDRLADSNSLGTWFAAIGNPCSSVWSFWTHPSERIMKWR